MKDQTGHYLMSPDKARAAYTLAHLGRKVQGHHPIWRYRP
jgi:hypothetical protein